MTARELFDRFRTEVRDDVAWDSEFTPSPHDPGRRLREFVDGVDVAEAVTLLLGALDEADPDLGRWACAGLEQLGPAAGDAAADVLAERVSTRRDSAAAVALDAIAPARARELGVHRRPETMADVTGRYLALGDTAIVAYVEWFLATQADEDIVRLLADVRLRHKTAGLARGLLRGDHSKAVRREAAEILAWTGVGGVTEELIDALSEGGPLSERVVERVAAHPASERLVPRLADAESLATLITRRRCAGLTTEPTTLRAFQKASGPGIPTAIADLRDESLLADLLPRLHADRHSAREWAALIRAFASYGEYGRALLEEGRALDEVDRFRTADQWLEVADRAFLQGQIDPAVEGAFAAYGDALLLRPSAHAAFQLAWIDRAFGAPVPAGRVDWIRTLGFTDETLLAHLADPVDQPLDGHRSGWESRKDPARALAAGLPSLAARWSRDDTHVTAARAHLEGVRRGSRS